MNIEKLDMNNVIVTLVNKDYYKDILEANVHEDYLDMVVLYKQMLHSDDEGFITRTIAKSEFEELGLAMDDFKQTALENTKRLFPAVLSDFCGMRFLSNKDGVNGASAILYSSIVRDLADELESDLFLVPSSIHEFILLAKNDGFEASDLCTVIHEANGSVVEGREILSDHPYLYERETKTIRIA